MRRLPFAAALFVVAILGAGCKKGPSLVGKWTANANGQPLNFEFKPDNTFTLGMKARGMSMNATGDYKLDGENLTMTTKDMDVPGVPRATIERLEKDPRGKFGQPANAKIKFVSDDEISFTGQAGAAGGAPSQTVNLTRVKEGV